MTTAHMTAPVGGLDIGPASIDDGAELWRIARGSGELDLNSPYSYLLWCRDFADTTAVARDASGRPVGFVTGYLRPDAPETLFVWQVAVEGSHRGSGVAGTLLDALTARVAAEHGVSRVEATVTPGNLASDRLFRSYARRRRRGPDAGGAVPFGRLPRGRTRVRGVVPHRPPRSPGVLSRSTAS